MILNSSWQDELFTAAACPGIPTGTAAGILVKWPPDILILTMAVLAEQKRPGVRVSVGLAAAVKGHHRFQNSDLQTKGMFLF